MRVMRFYKPSAYTGSRNQMYLHTIPTILAINPELYEHSKLCKIYVQRHGVIFEVFEPYTKITEDNWISWAIEFKATFIDFSALTARYKDYCWPAISTVKDTGEVVLLDIYDFNALVEVL